MLQLAANLAGAALLVIGFFGFLSINPADRKGAMVLTVSSGAGLLFANLVGGKPALAAQWLLVGSVALFACLPLVRRAF